MMVMLMFKSIYAKWARYCGYRRLATGYCSLVDGNLVTWKNQKQHVVAQSSVEAWYRRMAHGVFEFLNLKNLFIDLE